MQCSLTHALNTGTTIDRTEVHHLITVTHGHDDSEYVAFCDEYGTHDTHRLADVLYFLGY